MTFSLLLALSLLQATGNTYTQVAVVSDAKGQPIRDLQLADVSLTENGATIPIDRFERDERPLNVALVVDSSQPMATEYRQQFLDAVRQFAATLPEDARLTVWTTGDRPTRVIQGLAMNEEGAAKAIADRLSRVMPIGGNTVLDALVEAANELVKSEGGRRVLVFVSGQGPGFANDTREGVVQRVERTGVEVMGVTVTEGGAGGDVSDQDYDYVFSALATRTGGRLERALTSMSASVSLARVAADLRSTYRLHYFYSGRSRTPRLALQVARPGVKVRLSTPRKETSSP